MGKKNLIGRVEIDMEKCKGCGLCIEVCKNQAKAGNLAVGRESNNLGYFPAAPILDYCSGCGMCAIICPDACIEVYREE